jgi:hypothetical protein
VSFVKNGDIKVGDPDYEIPELLDESGSSKYKSALGESLKSKSS